MPEGVLERAIHQMPGSSGAWAACDVCAPLVGTNQWTALGRHVVARYRDTGRLPVPEPELAARLSAVWRQLRPHITGPPIRRQTAHLAPPLPPTSDRFSRWQGDGGYDWLECLDNGWYAVPAWGAYGWDLGVWPLVCVAHYDGPYCYAEAVYVEGDVDVRTVHTRAERDALTDRTAWLYWRLGQSHGPADLAEDDEQVSHLHRGPHSEDRHGMRCEGCGAHISQPHDPDCPQSDDLRTVE